MDETSVNTLAGNSKYVKRCLANEANELMSLLNLRIMNVKTRRTRRFSGFKLKKCWFLPSDEASRLIIHKIQEELGALPRLF